MAPRPRTLVIGLGNPILRDDSVGLRVVRALREQLPPSDEIEVAEDDHGGLRLMERMAGFHRAIVIDAIVTGAAPGTLHWLGVEDHPTQRTASAHDVDLPTALAVGRHAGAHLPDPEDIVILGIEVEEVLEFGETLSPAVEATIPAAVNLVMTRLREM